MLDNLSAHKFNLKKEQFLENSVEQYQKKPLLSETFKLVHGALRRMDGNLPLLQSLLPTLLYLLDNSKITISKLIVYLQVAQYARHFLYQTLLLS